MTILLLTSSLLALIGAVESCQSQLGGVCRAGTVYGENWDMVDRIETCARDGNQDWCTIVYSEYERKTQFGCYNYLAGNPLLPVNIACGDGLLNIRSGGCQRVPAYGGTACIVCCCKGSMCNNPYLFGQDLRQDYSFPYNDAPKVIPVFIIFIFLLLLAL